MTCTRHWGRAALIALLAAPGIFDTTAATWSRWISIIGVALWTFIAVVEFRWRRA